MADIELDSLRAFIAIIESGGFTAAGRILGRTQSAVSVKIMNLETALGSKLFRRTTRSLSVTPAGELLIGYARRMLDLNDEMLDRFHEPETIGEVRLGVAEYFAPVHLSSALARFGRVNPCLHINVRVGAGRTLLDDLDRGELDLVIATRDAGETRGRVFRRERLRWVASPALEISSTGPVPLCTLPDPSVFRKRPLEALKSQGRAWRITYTCESVRGVLAAVDASLGVAVVGEGSILDSLRVLRIEEGWPELGEIEIALFGENRGRQHLTRAVADFIEDQFKRLSPEAAHHLGCTEASAPKEDLPVARYLIR